MREEELFYISTKWSFWFHCLNLIGLITTLFKPHWLSKTMMSSVTLVLKHIDDQCYYFKHCKTWEECIHIVGQEAIRNPTVVVITTYQIVVCLVCCIIIMINGRVSIILNLRSRQRLISGENTNSLLVLNLVTFYYPFNNQFCIRK